MWGRLYERQLIPTYSLLTFNSLKEKFSSSTNPYPNSNGSYPPLPTHTAKGHSHQSLPHPRGSAPSIPAPKRSFPLIPTPQKVIPTSHYPPPNRVFISTNPYPSKWSIPTGIPSPRGSSCSFPQEQRLSFYSL